MNKKALTISTISLSLVAAFAITAGVSYAYFEKSKKIDITIQSSGRKNVQLFLGALSAASAWHINTVDSDCDIWMLTWKEANEVTVFEWHKQDETYVTAENGNDYLLFHFDPVVYDRLSFHRILKTQTPETFADRDYKMQGLSQNLTGVLTKPSDTNIYTIRNNNIGSVSYGFLSGGNWESETTEYIEPEI